MTRGSLLALMGLVSVVQPSPFFLTHLSKSKSDGPIVSTSRSSADGHLNASEPIQQSDADNWDHWDQIEYCINLNQCGSTTTQPACNAFMDKKAREMCDLNCKCGCMGFNPGRLNSYDQVEKCKLDRQCDKTICPFSRSAWSDEPCRDIDRRKCECECNENPSVAGRSTTTTPTPRTRPRSSTIAPTAVTSAPSDSPVTVPVEQRADEPLTTRLVWDCVLVFVCFLACVCVCLVARTRVPIVCCPRYHNTVNNMQPAAPQLPASGEFELRAKDDVELTPYVDNTGKH